MNAETLRRLTSIDMPAESLRAVLIVLADVQAREDARKAKDRDRKKRVRGNSAEIPEPIRGNGAEIPEDTPPPLLSPPTPPTNNPLPQPSLRSESVQAREAFIEFRKAYPRREGANPWGPAEKKFIACVRGGTDPAEIIAGVKGYAASVADADPRYTAQAITWLNQGRWRDDHDAPPPARAGPFNGAPPKRNTAFAVFERLSLEDESTSENPSPSLSAVR